MAASLMASCRVDDDSVDIHNRKNWRFAGSDRGREDVAGEVSSIAAHRVASGHSGLPPTEIAPMSRVSSFTSDARPFLDGGGEVLGF
jgi:hypothetical protein